jgi:hypothetical protein
MNPGESDATTPPPKRAAVRLADRLWDMAALGFVVAGLGLFLVARRALSALGSGTYEVAPGVSYVARTDLHVAQTRLAVWMIALGVTIGVIAALRHQLRGR